MRIASGNATAAEVRGVGFAVWYASFFLNANAMEESLQKTS
jgi:hypothetical protein